MLLAATRAQHAGHAGSWGWELSAPVSAGRLRRPLRRPALVAGLILIVGAIAGLAYWDAARESVAALQDFANEQATLASALGAALQVEAGPGGTVTDQEIRLGLRSVERPQALTLFLRRPGEAALRATDGRLVTSPRLIQALGQGQAAVRIPRDEAQAFGLHPRTAMAGLSHVDIRGTTWDIVAVASAERVRDRERGARRRLMLSVLTAAGLVLSFGAWDARRQRKEMLLERELAISALQQSRDERLERASRAAAMGTLAMGVAHEISTPLGVIAARAEQLAARAAGDERMSAGLAAILGQSDRINQIIRGLLGLARGDAPSAERIDPRAVVAGACGLVEHRFAKSGVRLGHEVGPGLAAGLPMVLGDPRLLEHAVVNLLLNACDACRAGGDVVISLRQRDGGVEIVVDDTGTGISPADAGRALEPFFTTKAREGGTGLGLAIAREIVASHRGTLLLSALEPAGTRAVIQLPPAEAQGEGEV
jgi:signal transduction histidine kinase